MKLLAIALVLLSSACFLATPGASACGVSISGTPHDTTIQHTVSFDSTSVTFGVVITQEQHSSTGGEPCTTLAAVESLPPTAVKPILVLS
ncbi:MAG: hypothetical protein QOE90_2613 [Thermoplasmata archaeon]|jgi:glutamine cyclotransferase|nr:hypothetical protein [Thermoplasmata archaeon]